MRLIAAAHLPPAVVIHGAADGAAALAAGRPATLLSAPGAALYAGCLWWRHVVEIARAGRPVAEVPDLLDCADSAGRALAALRAGLRGLILSPDTPGLAAVAAIARESGALLLTARPPALDLAQGSAGKRLAAWLGTA